MGLQYSLGVFLYGGVGLECSLKALGDSYYPVKVFVLGFWQGKGSNSLAPKDGKKFTNRK